MYGSLITRGLSLGGVALLAVAAAADSANAGGNHGEPPSVYEQTYTGPPIIRRIPGLRVLFGDRAMTEDEYDQLYDKKKKKKKIDESYYEPQPAPVKPKTPAKPPASPATAAAPGTPATPANPALPQKTASTAPAKPAAAAPVSCEQATQLVGGYGFSSVEASSCTGKLYAFNAKRGGKTFAIKVDPATGALTEVKKLP